MTKSILIVILLLVFSLTTLISQSNNMYLWGEIANDNGTTSQVASGVIVSIWVKPTLSFLPEIKIGEVVTDSEGNYHCYIDETKFPMGGNNGYESVRIQIGGSDGWSDSVVYQSGKIQLNGFIKQVLIDDLTEM